MPSRTPPKSLSRTKSPGLRRSQSLPSLKCHRWHHLFLKTHHWYCPFHSRAANEASGSQSAVKSARSSPSPTSPGTRRSLKVRYWRIDWLCDQSVIRRSLLGCFCFGSTVNVSFQRPLFTSCLMILWLRPKREIPQSSQSTFCPFSTCASQLLTLSWVHSS